MVFFPLKCQSLRQTFQRIIQVLLFDFPVSLNGLKEDKFQKKVFGHCRRFLGTLEKRRKTQMNTSS